MEPAKEPMRSVPLAVGALAALLAGACCFGPLLFVSLGIGGAWLANFQVLEPYRPIFIGVALVALGLAWKRIYRAQAECKPGEACVVPQIRRSYKVGFWTITGLLLVMLTFPYYAHFFY